MTYYHAQNVCSHNAVFSFVNSNRNYGKTWGFKRRAVVRGLKHRRKTLWVRRFKKETKECANTFFASEDLLKFCGLSWFDKETNLQGNLKREGNIFFVMRGKKWFDFLKIVTLSDANAMRSADDVRIDTIVFDEYTTTPQKYNLYRGDEIQDFIDLFFSIKRNHIVKCFFLGNKESQFNPYLAYFKIKPLPYTFEGIKCFRNGSIAVEQCNNVSSVKSVYDKQCFDLFKGTPYGDYIYNSKYKNDVKIKRAIAPQDAIVYVQLHFNRQDFCVKRKEDSFYVSQKLSGDTYVYSDVLQGKKLEKQLLKRHKTYFKALLNAICDNRVFYTDEVCFEVFQVFLKWLGTI